MIAGRTRRTLHNWPRVVELNNGGMRIQGRCVSVRTWLAAQVGCRVLILLAGVAFLAAGSMGIWSDLFSLLDRLLVAWLIRLRIAAGLTDLGLLAAGFVLVAGARVLGSLVAAVMLTVGRGVAGKRIAITIDAERLSVARWCGPLSFEREDNGPNAVRVRVVGVDEYFARVSDHQAVGSFWVPRMAHPPAIVEVSKGLKRFPVIIARRFDEAEAIVARLNEVLLDTRNSMPAIIRMAERSGAYA